MKNSKAGFTLVELIVTLAAAAIVTAAAVSLLLLGVRMQKGTNDNASETQDLRIITAAVEKIVENGQIEKIVYSGYTPDGSTNANDTAAVQWWLVDSGGNVVLSYNSESGAVYSGDFDEDTSSVLIDGIVRAEANYDRQLLTVELKNEDGEVFSTSIYCRTGVDDNALDNTAAQVVLNSVTIGTAVSDDEPNGMSADEKILRTAFLARLATQYGTTDSRILDYTMNGAKYESQYDYFSHWYIRNANSEGWDKDTPWCACFIAWGFGLFNENGIRFTSANCEITKNMFLPYGSTPKEGKEYIGIWYNAKNSEGEINYIPAPGDLVLFQSDKDSDADHIGAVLKVDTENKIVYCLEGNHNDSVGVFTYPLLGESFPYIMGYGVVNWTEHFTVNGSVYSEIGK